MKTSEIIFIDTGSVSDFVRLAAQLNGKIKGNAILINNEQGSGYIKKVELENGLVLQVWHCRFSARTILYYYPAPVGSPAICSLAYNLNGGSIVFTGHTPTEQQQLVLAASNTFFGNNSSPALFELMEGKSIQFIYITISREWITRQFRNTEKKLTDTLEQYTNKKMQPLLTACSPPEHFMVSEIFQQMTAPSANALVVQSRVFLLLASFWEKLLSAKINASDEYSGYFKKITKAEIILNIYLRSSLPALRSIAAEVGLSESSLKRYFKLVYGKNVYEYYLAQKNGTRQATDCGKEYECQPGCR